MDNTTLQALSEKSFSKKTLIAALLLTGKDRQELFRIARNARAKAFPEGKVEMRSVIEISNICRQRCNFCAISSIPRKARYTLQPDTILKIADHLHNRNRRVLSLQSGENATPGFIDMVSGCVSGIKDRYPELVVILSLGNLPKKHYKKLKKAGADRYIIKFETSNPGLYSKIKPRDSLKKRVKCIETLIDLGFKVGSGNIVGLPGQSLDDLADDLLFIKNMRLSMISATAFIPGEGSVFRNEPRADIGLVLNYMALLRILYPSMIIPSTSSLDKYRENGLLAGLMAGANCVTVHDGTPKALETLFPIYSVKRISPNEQYIKEVVYKAGLKI